MTEHAVVVVAIDFGTTYSGWAYSFKDKPRDITTGQWYLGSEVKFDQTPTNVLIDSDGKTLNSFGYEAQENYSNYVAEGKEDEYFYFKQFKMCLHETINNQSLDRNITLTDVSGKRRLPAIDVFACGIQYLANDCLETINKRVIRESDCRPAFEKTGICWVLTVPAIWTDAAKQFMREAAEMAGIPGNCLQIVLEPEAASVFCRQLSFRLNSSYTGELSISTLSKDSKYMVVDAGGGTVDITVHEIVGDQRVKEVIAASGGGWGGHQVNEHVINLIENLCDKDEFETFMKEYEGRSDLETEIEAKKRTFSSEAGTGINLRIPSKLRKMISRKTPDLVFTMANPVQDILHRHGLYIRGDKLYIQAEIIKELFAKAVEKTIQHIKSLMQKTEVEATSAILMVGGYSDCKFLQEEIRTSFPHIGVVQPSSPNLCVIKGAILFGHDSEYISGRVLKHTFGLKLLRPFKIGDPESRKVMTVKGPMCNGCFIKHAVKGQMVRPGESKFVKSYLPAYRNQTSMSFPIYSSTRKNPVYVDDKGCFYIGKLVLKMGNLTGDLNRTVSVEFMLGGAELKVKASLQNSPEAVAASFDFLGEKPRCVKWDDDEETDTDNDVTVNDIIESEETYMMMADNIGVVCINLEDPTKPTISFIDDPAKVSMMGRLYSWQSRSILITSDGKAVCSIGEDAETDYNHEGSSESTEHLLFPDILLDVYNHLQTHGRPELFESQCLSGKRFPCKLVLVRSIEYIFQQFVKTIFDARGLQILASDLRIVLIVPTALNEKGSQLIIAALEEADIPVGQRFALLAAEAVAAHVLNEGPKLGLKSKETYVLLEAGDQFHCVTLHWQSNVSSSVASSYRHSLLEGVVEKMVGEETYKLFRQENPLELTKMERNLLLKIQRRTWKNDDDIRLRIAHTLMIHRHSFRPVDGVSLTHSQFQIKSEVYLQWYDSFVQDALHLLRKVMTGQVRSILIIGSFSEFDYLRNAVRKAFPNVNVLTDRRSDEFAIRGAMSYGHQL